MVDVPSESPIVAANEVAMAMRDGTMLRADVYLPSGEREHGWSTVLMRTPYDKSVPKAELDIDAYVRHGFAVVIQDSRGRYRSDGSHYHGRGEDDDGYDTLAWIAVQPWSNGKIGMTGLSYPAAVQVAAACSGSPHLASLFHVKAPSDYYLNGCRRGGNRREWLMVSQLRWACTSPEASRDPMLAQSALQNYVNAPTWLERLPFRPGQNPLSRFHGQEQLWLDIQNQTEYSDFWKQSRLWSPEEYLDDFVDVPALFVGGWYDAFREDRFFTVLNERKQGPIHLIMGPWGHKDVARSVGDVDFGPEAGLDPDAYTRLQLEWFDESLNDIAPETLRPAVSLFVMGGGSGRKTEAGLLDHGGRWRNADDWPPPEARATPFYLRAGGGLSTSAPASDEGGSSYVHDPRHPVPTIGGTGFFLAASVLEGLENGPRGWSGEDLLVPYGPHDQRERLGLLGCTSELPLWSRPDVLTFETEPLQQAVEVTGLLEARLWISSTAVDTDFFIRLVDVYPPNEDYPAGYAMNLCDGVLRASYREGFERRVLLEPQTIYELHLGTALIDPTSNLFAPGHRIRLHIASSDYPGHDVNPGDGSPASTAGLPVIARNTIYHDATHPSHVVLPIVPA